MISLALAVGCASSGPPLPVFEEVSSELGLKPRNPTPRAYGPFWADLDGDGWQDLVFVDHAGRPPSIYLNRGGTHFEEYFAASGIPAGSGYPQSSDRHGGSAADFDNDGALDLIFSRGAKRGETLGIKFDQLLRGRGDGRFEDVSQAMGALNSQGRGRTPSWVDFDRDGWLDLYLGNANSANVLYRNLGGAGFADVTDTAGLGLAAAYSQTWVDFDLDGWDDVLTTPRPRLFRNVGDGSFLDVSNETGLGEVVARKRLRAVSQAWGDFDNDGDPDLFLSDWLPGKSTLLRNEAGRFVELPGEFGPEEEATGAGARWADIESDGDLDLLVLTTASAAIYANTDTGFLRRPLALTGIEPGTDFDGSFADYDRDGRLDLALQTPEANHLVRNVAASGSWLEVMLRGRQSNRQGFGASVRSIGSSGPVFRQHGDSGTLHSSGAAPLRLGLGRVHEAELKIRWPLGKRQLFARLPVDRALVVYEGAPAAEGADHR